MSAKRSFHLIGIILSLTGVFTVAYIQAALAQESSSSFAAQSSLDDSILFLDKHEPNNADNFGGFTGQSWQTEEKGKVLGYLKIIQEKAPGLLRRATIYRPLKLYRQNTMGKLIISPNLRAENAIVFTDLFFQDPHGPKIVTHEIAHLADSSLKVTNSKEWVNLVRPRIEKVRARLKKEGLTLIEAIWVKQVNREDLAHEEGLPSLYAASDEMEALSEYVASIVTAESVAVPASIKAFIESRLLAVSVKPDESTRYFHEGLSFLVLKQSDNALASFDRAIKLDPGFVAAYEERAKVWLQKGDPDKAISDLSQTINLGSVKSESIRYDRAELLSKKQKWDEAIADYSTVIERNPAWSYPLIGRGKAWTNKKEYDKAIADYDKAIKTSPENAYAYLLRGDCKRLKKDVDGALADLSKAISIKPDYAAAYFWRGIAYRAKQDPLNAKKDLHEALRLEPQLKNNVEPLLKDIDAALSKQKAVND
jgi:tetratricopeptide (TPR) repeat protein